ncbi:hypothetical protein CcaverHIS641_0504100 [Cutaneotrichosporon cavernicola]|nr:hypothetical protein CcaverHIS641_0504100 [Cutaneotrichosporon cavernicola]
MRTTIAWRTTFGIGRYLGGRRGVHLLRDLPQPTAKQLLRYRLTRWTAQPTSMLIVHKPDDERVRSTMRDVLSMLTKTYPQLRLLVEPHTARDHPEFDQLVVVDKKDVSLLPENTHLVLTLGGDGTVLHVANLFSQGECPPVLCFSMGSLGFLLPFHISQLNPAVQRTLTGPVPILNRMRVECKPQAPDGSLLERCGPKSRSGWQVMNEVSLHRGRHPHLAVVDMYFDGQHLTEAVSDGLLLSTPTGSTAYSLSAGGPISHPEADALLLTPIAPRSLSFRPIVLPGHGVVRLEISPRARAPAELSIDGREVCLLNAHESVVIRKSPFPIPCVERVGQGTGWVRDINSLLQFNVGFVNKSLEDPGH